MEEFTPNESELKNEVMLFARINHKEKIVSITENMLSDISNQQMLYLMELKKRFKYVLQYTIE